MSRRIRRKNKFDVHLLPVNTVTSIVLASVNFIILIVAIIKSTLADGKMDIMIGLVGVLEMVIGAYGIYYAIKGIKEDNSNYMTLPLVAIISNSVIMLILVIMYIVGIILSVKG